VNINDKFIANIGDMNIYEDSETKEHYFKYFADELFVAGRLKVWSITKDADCDLAKEIFSDRRGQIIPDIHPDKLETFEP